jgi:Xaa-Pro dipeptidase
VAEGLARTLDEMARQDVDVLALGREGNARFVSGATRLWLAGTRPFAPGCVVVRETEAIHLLSVTAFGVPSDIPPEHLYPTTWNPANIMSAVAAIPGVAGARRIGVDGLTPLFEQLFAATLPDAHLTDGDAVVRAARRVKSSADVEHIRAAIAVAQEALGAVVDVFQPGVRENELKGVFEERMCQLGTTTPALEATFCVGPNRSFVSDRRIEDADLVWVKAGVLLEGWEGSLARTWSCGAPTTEHERRLSIWNELSARLVDQCRPATRAREIQAISPGVAVHGVGLGYEGLEGDAVLDAGMVIGVELEAEGVLGADTLLIRDGEPDRLTTFPHSATGK